MYMPAASICTWETANILWLWLLRLILFCSRHSFMCVSLSNLVDQLTAVSDLCHLVLFFVDKCSITRHLVAVCLLTDTIFHSTHYRAVAVVITHIILCTLCIMLSMTNTYCTFVYCTYITHTPSFIFCWTVSYFRDKANFSVNVCLNLSDFDAVKYNHLAPTSLTLELSEASYLLYTV